MDLNQIINHKFTCVAISEGRNCNLNGDADNEGAPRQDPETGLGLVSPQSLKRRINDQIYQEYGHLPGYELHIQRGVTIEEKIIQAGAKVGVAPPKGKEKISDEDKGRVRDQCCVDFGDLRNGGGVLGVGALKVFGVNGVCTWAWGESVEPITIRQDTLTRVNSTNEGQEKDTEMGRRYVIQHGVYKQVMFVNPFHAAQNKMTMRDLAIYFKALARVWEWKRSVMSGMISVRGIWIFRHDSKYGSAPDHTLVDRVQVKPNKDNPHSWDDYDLRFDDAKMPAGIKVFTLEDMFTDIDTLGANLAG